MAADTASPDVPDRSANVVDPFGFVGTLLDRKYRVDRVVAEGGFAVVYAGLHLALGSPIAVKVLRPASALGATARDELLELFLQEGRTIARLRHPNIVSVLDAGIATHLDAPVPWMVFEWLDGETMQDELRARRGRGGRSPAECLAILRPVILAVAEAHEAGIVHRDLKPSNIMRVQTKRGVVPRVLDFGIAKVMAGDERASAGDTTTRQAFHSFSLGYAAPEQIVGTRTGPWTDVHAIGLLLTELLTDAAPYADAEPAIALGKVVDARRPTPGKLGVDVGPWEGILARALALRPVERYATLGELLAALDESVDRAEKRFGRRARRDGRRWLAVATIAAAVAALAGALHASGRNVQSASKAPPLRLAAAPPSTATAATLVTLETDAEPRSEPRASAPRIATVPSARASSAVATKPAVRPPVPAASASVAPNVTPSLSTAPKPPEPPTWLD
jgi:serine/threonine protein kinase